MLSQIEQREQKEIGSKHFNSIKWMRQQRFGNSISAFDFDNIYYLNNHSLYEVQNFVFAHGLDFCLPPAHIKQEEILAEFEVLMGLLQHHSPTSKVDFYRLLARLNNLAYSFCGSSIDKSNFNMQRKFFKTIKSLRDNPNV